MVETISQAMLNEWFRYEPETGKLFWLKKRPRTKQNALIDEAGCVRSFGILRYRSVRLFKKAWASHRLIWIMHHGLIPDDMVIDHIDGNGLNNRLDNLRLVTPSENAKNRMKAPCNQTARLGVRFDDQTKKWRATITVNYKNKCLGYFNSAEEAAAARKSAEKLYGFHENHGRKQPSMQG